MSEFFESEIIQEELEEINKLQREFMENIMNLNKMPDEDPMRTR